MLNANYQILSKEGYENVPMSKSIQRYSVLFTCLHLLTSKAYFLQLADLVDVVANREL